MELRRPVTLDERGVVADSGDRDPESVARVVHVQVGITRERIPLVGDGRVEHVLQNPPLADVDADQRQAVCGREIRGPQVNVRVRLRAQSRRRHGLRLRLVQGGQRPATAVAEQHHALTAGVAQHPDAGRKVEKDFLVNGVDVIVDRPPGPPDYRVASPDQGRDVVVQRLVGPRVHQVHSHPRLPPGRPVEQPSRQGAVGAREHYRLDDRVLRQRRQRHVCALRRSRPQGRTVLRVTIIVSRLRYSHIWNVHRRACAVHVGGGGGGCLSGDSSTGGTRDDVLPAPGHAPPEAVHGPGT